VQDGLIEVVLIEDGTPYYRIATEFVGPLETMSALGRLSEARECRSSFGWWIDYPKS